jgi:hypothetical protein
MHGCFCWTRTGRGRFTPRRSRLTRPNDGHYSEAGEAAGGAVGDPPSRQFGEDQAGSNQIVIPVQSKANGTAPSSEKSSDIIITNPNESHDTSPKKDRPTTTPTARIKKQITPRRPREASTGRWENRRW